MISIFKKWARRLGYLIAVMIIMSATLVSLSGLLTPLLNAHRIEFEKWAQELLHVPVSIHNVHIAWHYYKPVLSFEQVILLDDVSKKPNFKINEIKININVIKSLIQRKPMLNYIKISGIKLNVHEVAPGKINIDGLGEMALPNSADSQTDNPNKIAELIFSEDSLNLANISINYTPIRGKPRHVMLKALSLNNSMNEHKISGYAVIEDILPIKVNMEAKWEGMTFNPEKISGSTYLYVEGISFPAWINKKINNIEIKQGLGSAKIWASWKDNQWQKIQTQFQIFDLELFSELTQKSQMIKRINGNLGWRQDNGNQILAGNDIIIDFPDHFWPTTAFEVMWDHQKITSLKVDYINLNDTLTLALQSGLLPDSIQKKLLTLSPQGELKSLIIENYDPTQLANTHLSSKFIDLSFNPIEKIPGMWHLYGDLSWNGTQGDVHVTGQHSIFVDNDLFVNALHVNELSGYGHIEKDLLNHWVLTVNKIKAVNDELHANASMTLQLFPNAPPLLDLNANFDLANASHVSNYLPLNRFHADLSRWLKKAFQGGKIISGQAIVKGNLKDFPFDKKKGEFLLSGELQNVNFNYAAAWPTLEAVNGHLIFSGLNMKFNLQSGKILNIPITQGSAEIPHMGGRDAVVNIKTNINSDLLRGLAFIHQSPLEKTLGKDLGDLKLTGPMQLNLALTIPLAKPIATQVNGDINFSKSTLDMPAWHLAMTDMTGLFRFTEKEIHAKNVKGFLFNEPINLDLNTVSPKNAASSIKAILKSQISIQSLEDWLKIPISTVAQGKTNYTAELNLVSRANSQPSQLTVRSLLKGVSVSIPFIENKKPEINKSFIVIVNLQKNQPLRIKSSYSDILTAAMTFQQNHETLKLKSGMLRFGNKESADWQTQPGLVISGHLPSLDLSQWKNYFSTLSNQSTGQSPNVLVDELREIDIQVDRVKGLPQTLTRAHCHLLKSNHNWFVNLNSTEMSGEMTIPLGLTQPIKAKFKYLYLNPTGKSDALDPKTIPAFSFYGNDVRLHNQNFGRVSLEIAHLPNGVDIKQLQIETPLYHLSANGDWQSQQKLTTSRLKGKLNAKNVSQFLNEWHINSSNLIGSAVTADFDLKWLSAPYSPTLSGMSGTTTLNLNRGRIINLGESTDAKMGIGRLLNILSLQTIPHLLTFDFSGVFAQGYSFDYLKGDFILKNGSAYTKNMRSDGSVARVEIAGRFGLNTKDYNIHLNVTPYVTGSIPVVAALAVNPIAGVAAWAVEKFAQSAVSKVTTYRYLVSGTWENPVWKQQ